MRSPALCLALLCGGLVPRAAHATDWKQAFTFRTARTATHLSITLVPKPGFYVNSTYPMKVTLTSATVKLEKAKLRRSDIQFERAGHEGKANKASLRVGATGSGRVDAAYKISICTLTGCSPPLKGTISNQWQAPAPPPKPTRKPSAAKRPRRRPPGTASRPARPPAPPPPAAGRGCGHRARPGAHRIGA